MHLVYYNYNGQQSYYIGCYATQLDAKIAARKKGINGLNGIIKPMHLSDKDKKLNNLGTYKRKAAECDAIVTQIHALVSNHLNVNYVSGVSRCVFDEILKIIAKEVK